MQVLSVLAVSEGWLDGVDPERAPPFVKNLVARLRSEQPDIVSCLERGELPEDDWLERIRTFIAGLRPVAEESRS